MKNDKDFGLPENVEEQENNPVVFKKSHKGRNFLIVVIIILILVLVAICAYKFVPRFAKFIDDNKATIENKCSKNRDTDVETIDNDAIDNDEAEAEAEVLPIVEPEPVVIAQDGNFLVIAGSFADPNNAEKYKKSMQDLGFENLSIFQGRTYTHVVVSSFNDKDEALRESKKLNRERNIESWVFEKK
jgi:flagellar basal body-associated protein FliL